MDSTEYYLLEEIKDAPYDNDLRLVYADWLMERGDWRAEFVRLEVEMETYWRETSVIDLAREMIALSAKFGGCLKWEKIIINKRFSDLYVSLERVSMEHSKKESRRQNSIRRAALNHSPQT